MGQSPDPPLTTDQARTYAERWRTVNEREREELRAMTPAEKFGQVEALYAFAKALDRSRSPAEEAEKAVVRARWRRLRESYRER